MGKIRRASLIAIFMVSYIGMIYVGRMQVSFPFCVFFAHTLTMPVCYYVLTVTFTISEAVVLSVVSYTISQSCTLSRCAGTPWHMITMAWHCDMLVVSSLLTNSESSCTECTRLGGSSCHLQPLSWYFLVSSCLLHNLFLHLSDK